MSDKINYAECMKRKCQQCKFYDKCFRYKPKKEGDNNENITRSIKQKFRN